MAGCNEPTLMTTIDIPYTDTEWRKTNAQSLGLIADFVTSMRHRPALLKDGHKISMLREFVPIFK